MAAWPTGSRSTSSWLDAELFEHAEAEIAAPAGADARRSSSPAASASAASEGKIAWVHFAREREVPFFGICLGMQMACIEAARNTAGIERCLLERIRRTAASRSSA